VAANFGEWMSGLYRPVVLASNLFLANPLQSRCAGVPHNSRNVEFFGKSMTALIFVGWSGKDSSV